MDNASIPNVKLLKKLADACRKAGISTFKGYGFEFTLQPVAPKAIQAPKKEIASKANHGAQSEAIPTDEPTEQELMFWSVTDHEEEESVEAPNQ